MENGTLRISAQGMPSHAAKPEGSRNAIAVLADVLKDATFLKEARGLWASVSQMLGDYYGEGAGLACADQDSGRLTHVSGMMSCSAHTLQLNLNIRYPIHADGEALVARLRESVAAKAFHVVQYQLNPPGYFDPAHPIIEKLGKLYGAYSGDTAVAPYTDVCATYARKLLAAVCFGPQFPKSPLLFSDGRGNEHMADECISLQNLLKAAEIYVMAILEIDRTFN